MQNEIFKKEYIICSAIWFNDGKNYKHQPINIESGFVVCGYKHHDCLTLVSILNYDLFQQLKSIPTIQGFITSKNKFVNRKEAYQIAKNNNQLIFNGGTEYLTSELIYSFIF